MPSDPEVRVPTERAYMGAAVPALETHVCSIPRRFPKR